MTKKLSILNRDGWKISIRLTTDSKDNKLVFLQHGLGARNTYPHMLVLEEVFAQNGFNVVNIDATNSLNESDSTPEGITFTGFYNDLEDVIAWAKTQDFYVEPFALAGQSLGAEAVVLYASLNPDKVNLLVPAAFPWLDGKVECVKNKRTESILKNGFYDQVSKSTGRVLRFRKNYLDDVQRYDLTGLVKNITAHTYLIVGLKDSEYHIQNNKKLFELLQCKKKLFLLPDVPHDLANTPENKETFTKTLESIFEDMKADNVPCL